jgi:hypothetical protein
VIGSIQTKLGEHILKVEKWFPAELSELVREQILKSLFHFCLKRRGNVEPPE